MTYCWLQIQHIPCQSGFLLSALYRPYTIIKRELVCAGFIDLSAVAYINTSVGLLCTLVPWCSWNNLAVDDPIPFYPELRDYEKEMDAKMQSV